jgi:hypothetical protein
MRTVPSAGDAAGCGLRSEGRRQEALLGVQAMSARVHCVPQHSALHVEVMPMVPQMSGDHKHLHWGGVHRLPTLLPPVHAAPPCSAPQHHLGVVCTLYS